VTAIDHAAAIAAVSGPGLYPTTIPLVIEEYDEMAKSLLEDASTRAVGAGVRATTHVLEGRPAHAIVDFAQDSLVDAIVIGTQGKRGLQRAFLGSTAEGVLRMTDVPTFIVHASGDAPTETTDMSGTELFTRILVAVDDSDPADAAMNLAADLAAVSHGRILCCNAIDTGHLLRMGANYAYDPTPMLDEMHRAGHEIVENR